MDRQSAFFMNGGAGRHISSIPALELYAKENPVSYTHLTLPTSG